MMKPLIECRTVTNGYSLTLDNKEYFYTSLGKLLIGASWHILHDSREYADMEEIIEVMTSRHRLQEIRFIREKIRVMKGNYERMRNKNIELKEEIKVLKNKLKAKKK